MFARATRDRAGNADIALFPMVPALAWGDAHRDMKLLKRREEDCPVKTDEIERGLRMKERQGGGQ